MALARSFIKPEILLHVQIHRINAVATLAIMTKRTEMDRYIIHRAVTMQDKKQTPKTQNKKTDQCTGNWKMQEEMITLYHLRDCYGKKKRTARATFSQIYGYDPKASKTLSCRILVSRR